MARFGRMENGESDSLLCGIEQYVLYIHIYMHGECIVYRPLLLFIIIITVISLKRGKRGRVQPGLTKFNSRVALPVQIFRLAPKINRVRSVLTTSVTKGGGRERGRGRESADSITIFIWLPVYIARTPSDGDSSFEGNLVVAEVAK